MTYFSTWSTPDLLITRMAFNNLTTDMEFKVAMKESQKEKALMVIKRCSDLINAINDELARRK